MYTCTCIHCLYGVYMYFPLQVIEDTILKLLFESKGNILDDEKLIETLDASKVTNPIIS